MNNGRFFNYFLGLIYHLKEINIINDGDWAMISTDYNNGLQMNFQKLGKHKADLIKQALQSNFINFSKHFGFNQL